jgi:hypothetical protein
MFRLSCHRVRVCFWLVTLSTLAVSTSFLDGQVAAPVQQTAPRFGGAYADLDARRQRLIDAWVARFNEVMGQQMVPGPFYDTYVKLSTKTTFEAGGWLLEDRLLAIGARG